MNKEILAVFFLFLSIGFLLQKTNIYAISLNLISNSDLKNKLRKKPSKKLHRSFYGFGIGIVVIHLLNSKYSLPFFLESLVIFAPLIYAVLVLRKLNKDSSLESIIDIILAGLIAILSTIAVIFI